MSRNNELLKNTMVLGLGKFATQFITILLLPIYTIFLSPADYGMFDLMLTYIAFILPVATIRLELAAFRFLIDARKNEVEKTRIISTSLQLVFYTCVVISLLFLGAQYFLHIPHGYLALGVALAMVSSSMLLQYARGLGSNIKFAIASILIGSSTSLLSILLVAGLQWGITGILMAAAAGNLIGCLYLIISLRLHTYVRPSHTSRKLRKELLAYGAPLVPSGMSWWVINGLDRTLITLFIGLPANGIYALASRYALILASATSVFGLAWNESASLHINDKDRDAYFTQIINTSIKLFGAIGLVLIAITPFAFDILINPQYSEALQYIPILIIATFFNAIIELYNGIYIAKKLTTRTAVTNIFIAVLAISLNLIFIKFIGLYAAAFSILIAYCTMTLWRYFDTKKFVTIKYDFRSFTLLGLAFAIVVSLYYIDIFLLHIVNIALTASCTFLLNRSVIRTIKTKLLKRRPLSPDQEVIEEIETNIKQ